jgi:hypothetical protein
MNEPLPLRRTSKPAPDEVRTLLVHPTVWRSLEAWLHDMRIGLVRLPSAVESTPMYRMAPLDGPWGGGPDAA